jgi:uncharacterized protein YrrD
MYALASKLESLPIISLQTGETIGTIDRPVISPDALSVAAYRCDTPSHGSLLLLVRDIRQTAPDCIIIDSEDELTAAQDVVRLQTTLEQNYTPLDKPVVTDMGRKLGVVEDFTISLEDSRVQKLYIRQPLFRAWLGSSLIIDRAQIIDVTPHKFMVRDSTTPIVALGAEPSPESHS